MKTTITRPALSCDGCDYLISKGVQIITLTVRGEEFHFHDGGEGAAERHDCFRYWAHGPRVMEKSLTARGWSVSRIDEFLCLMLYRSGVGSPGITPEKEKVG